MGSEKSSRARRAAESLFGPSPTSGTTKTNRPANPFDDHFADSGTVAPAQDELVTLPGQIELPPGYQDVAQMRDALARAWRMDWVKTGKDASVVRLPVGWGADRSVDGVLRIYSAGVTRAEGKLVEGAVLRILPRYYMKAEFHASDDHCRIVIFDRHRNSILKDSFWDTRSGPNHPQWKLLSDWLDQAYPQHRDPLRYWEDCEDNLGRA